MKLNRVLNKLQDWIEKLYGTKEERIASRKQYPNGWTSINQGARK